ncbi:serine hydrolase domain-containing protein [Nocardia sp. NPDC060259]|uniref:serine hydrolase domain-containing protein n=1 Tax=Nocardia sp. NPDC060259 TaxID=3347088 RepID=UPI0036693900
MSTSDKDLAAFVTATAAEYGIPGAAVGITIDGAEFTACHGVTSIDNPLPVDENTVFQLGSVSKSYTATALLRLVADGRVALDAPVRRYLPELTLADEQLAAEVTVGHLLNHTAGLDWKLDAETGDGDDALARFVDRLPELPVIAPLGARASYSQSGYSLAGRVIEKVTGLTFEQAIRTLLFDPIGLRHSFFTAAEVLPHRFAVGHTADDNGELSVLRQWGDNRANNPGAGVASSVADQLRWARFHLGDGHTADGESLLPTALLHSMREQTAPLRASSLGDGFGICWFLRDVDGVRTVGHGGSGYGQFAELLTVPDRRFAVVALSNAGPDAGLAFNQAVLRWALEHYLGLVERDPEPLPYDATRAAEIAGVYENDMMRLTIADSGTAVSIDAKIKPEIRAASDTELPDDLPFADLGLRPDDEYFVTEGGLTGQRGYFSRDTTGTITGVDLAGRLFSRIP